MALATVGNRSRQSASRSPNQRARHGFAESNQRVRIELNKSKVQLEKEFSRLEKQSRTETNNICNHQQALKMTWRRLEQRRQQERPVPERLRKETDATDRRGLLYSKTTMSVDDTAAIYGKSPGAPRKISAPSTTSSENDDDALYPTSSDPGLKTVQVTISEAASPLSQRRIFAESPYVSSPFGIRRRDGPRKARHSLDSSLSSPHVQQWGRSSLHPLKMPTFSTGEVGGTPPTGRAQMTKSSSLDIPVVQLDKVQSIPVSSSPKKVPLDSTATSKKPTLKLPPLQGPSSRSEVLIARSNTTDKETLLKAADMMKSSSSSHSPNAFQQFYSTSTTQSSTELGSKILLSPAVVEDRTLEIHHSGSTGKPAQQERDGDAKKVSQTLNTNCTSQ